METGDLTLEDFPFEERLEGQERYYEGLEKLRCIRNRRTRELLWRLYEQAQPDRRAIAAGQIALPLDPRAPVIGKDPRFP